MSHAYHSSVPNQFGELLCACWCDTVLLYVPAALVRAGQTLPCSDGCTPERHPLPAKGREGTGEAGAPTLRGGPAPVPDPPRKAS